MPLIGCRCPVCNSTDPRNHRRRASLWFEIDGVRVLVDASTDLRIQALDNALPGVDTVLFTHTHADHVHGIDDLRQFNFLQRRRITCYGDARTTAHLRRIFPYIFDPDPRHPSAVPMLDLEEVCGPIACGRGAIVPVPIEHGREQILGYRIGSLAYLTDISGIPPESRPLLAGVRTVVLGALRHTPHPHHLTVDEACRLAEELGVARAVFTHMSHDLDYQSLRQTLPAGIEPGFDGLVLPFDWDEGA